MSFPIHLKSYKVRVKGFDIPEADLKFSIDWSRITEDMAKQLVEFHIDKDDLAFEADDDLEMMLVLKTVRFGYLDAIQNDHNARGVNSELEDAEGWPGNGEIKFEKVQVDEIDLRMEDLDFEGE